MWRANYGFDTTAMTSTSIISSGLASLTTCTSVLAGVVVPK